MDKSFDFAVRIVKLVRFLNDEKREFTLAKQILRSGTSIGVNVKEAIRAQSKLDFRAKMSISLKEASETEYWIELLYKTEYIDKIMYESLNRDCVELIKMLTAIVKTAQNYA